MHMETGSRNAEECILSQDDFYGVDFSPRFGPFGPTHMKMSWASVTWGNSDGSPLECEFHEGKDGACHIHF